MSALKSLSGFCNHSPLFFLIMKRVQDLFRHICLILVGILLSNFIQYSADLPVFAAKNSKVEVPEKPRLMMASLTPILPAREIKQVAAVEKPLPKMPPRVDKPIVAAKIKRAENQSGPSRYFDTLIKSMASSLASKYHGSAPVIEGFLYEVCERQYEIGIPAPVMMAIALKESAFKSSLFRQTGNPFGIKAGKSWNGPTISIRRRRPELLVRGLQRRRERAGKNNGRAGLCPE